MLFLFDPVKNMHHIKTETTFLMSFPTVVVLGTFRGDRISGLSIKLI